MKFLLIVVFALIAVSADAGYRVVGKVTGEECTSYVLFDKCVTRTIDAVATKNGELHGLSKYYNQVSSYRKGRCWIRIKSKGLGLFSAGINAASGMLTPKFYERQPDGKYQHVDVETITFECEKE